MDSVCEGLGGRTKTMLGTAAWPVLKERITHRVGCDQSHGAYSVVGNLCVLSAYGPSSEATLRVPPAVGVIRLPATKVSTPAPAPPVVHCPPGVPVPVVSTPPVTFLTWYSTSSQPHSSLTLSPSTKQALNHFQINVNRKISPLDIKNIRLGYGSPSGESSMSAVPSSQNLCDSHDSGAVNVTSAPAKLKTPVTVLVPLEPTVPTSDTLHSIPMPTLVSSSMNSPVWVVDILLTISEPLSNHTANNVVSAEATATNTAIDPSVSNSVIVIEKTLCIGDLSLL